jgi:hypothetical protein
MAIRGILACVLLLCVASACEAQRFGIPFRPVYRPPTPVYRPPTPAPVFRPPTVVPLYRPDLGNSFNDTQPTGQAVHNNPSPPAWTQPSGRGDEQPRRVFEGSKPTAPTEVYTKPNPPVPPPPPAGGDLWLFVIVGVVLLAAIVFAVWSGTRSEARSPVTPLGTNRQSPPFPPPPPPASTVLVRVTSVPEGEAPEWVRQAWVGLVLPAVDRRPVPGIEVLSERQSVAPAYQVKTLIALTLLEIGERTAAADWWREHTTEANDPTQHFLFSPDCCTQLD